MLLLPLLIAVEIITATLTVNLSSHPKEILAVKHKIGSVLGVHLAQTEESAPAPAETAPAAEQATPAPAATDQTGAAASPQGSTTSDTTAPTDSQTAQSVNSDSSSPFATSVDDSTQLLNQTDSQNSNTTQTTETVSPGPVSATPIQGQQGAEEQTNLSQPSPIPESQQTENQTNAILNQGELFQNPDNISSQSVDEAKKEDQKLAEAQAPAEKLQLLLDFAKDKILDVDKTLKSDNFATANFAASRFDSQIDQALDTIKQLPAKEAAKAKKDLGSFCKQADLILRSAQLVVPEESEQDMEIARGRCLEANF